jgi:methylmalonyl-CoA mutase N-terminal domain/subunit
LPNTPRSAYELARDIEADRRVVVGVNHYTMVEDLDPDLQRVVDTVQEGQISQVRRVRAERDGDAVEAALADVAQCAESRDNLLPVMKEALRRMATVGEVCDALRGVFGKHTPTDAF